MLFGISFRFRDSLLCLQKARWVLISCEKWINMDSVSKTNHFGTGEMYWPYTGLCICIAYPQDRQQGSDSWEPLEYSFNLMGILCRRCTAHSGEMPVLCYHSTQLVCWSMCFSQSLCRLAGKITQWNNDPFGHTCGLQLGHSCIDASWRICDAKPAKHANLWSVCILQVSACIISAVFTLSCMFDILFDILLVCARILHAVYIFACTSAYKHPYTDTLAQKLSPPHLRWR